MEQIRTLAATNPGQSGVPASGTIHCSVSDPDLELRGLTVTQLHAPGCWVLREMNGNLRLETLAGSPEVSSTLAARLLAPTGGAPRPWNALRAQGYRIVHPVGPYFHPGAPSEFWGKKRRYGYWQTHGESWAGPAREADRGPG